MPRASFSRSWCVSGARSPLPPPPFLSQKKPNQNNRHFNAIAKHLIDTLTELGVKQQYVDEAIGVVATTKDAILGTGAYAGRK